MNRTRQEASPFPHARATQFEHGWAIRYFLQQRKHMLGLGFLLLLTVGLQVGTPLLLRAFLDAVTHGTETNTAMLFAALYVVMAIALRGVRAGEQYLAELVAWKATDTLRIDLVRHCLMLDAPFHQGHTPGELTEPFEEDGVRLYGSLLKKRVVTRIDI